MRRRRAPPQHSSACLRARVTVGRCPRRGQVCPANQSGSGRPHARRPLGRVRPHGPDGPRWKERSRDHRFQRLVYCDFLPPHGEAVSGAQCVSQGETELPGGGAGCRETHSSGPAPGPQKQAVGRGQAPAPAGTGMVGGNIGAKPRGSGRPGPSPPPGQRLGCSGLGGSRPLQASWEGEEGPPAPLPPVSSRWARPQGGRLWEGASFRLGEAPQLSPHIQTTGPSSRVWAGC